MKIRVLAIIGLAGLVGACMSPEPLVKKGASVERVEQGKKYNDFAVSYALPQTVINVKVVAEKTITKPGPFAAYAERFLGIGKVPTRETNEWKIKSVSINTSSQRDPSQVYRMSSEAGSRADRIQLNNEGVLLGVNMPPFQSAVYDLTNIRLNSSGDAIIPGYPDLTIRKNTEPMLDTVFQTVRTDTSFIRLPILREQISTKTLMNQAEEAANVIMKLRERKYWLVNGEFVIEEGLIPLPDGPALELMIREMEKMEHDYVSLFIGRNLTETKEYEFTIVPGQTGNRESFDLFAFSSFAGVLPAGSSNGDPVVLVLEPVAGFSGQTEIVEPDSGEKEVKGKGLAYRVPGLARVSVAQAGEELIAESYLIAQYGIIQFLPQQLLSQPDIMIRIHPELGSIEGIYEK